MKLDELGELAAEYLSLRELVLAETTIKHERRDLARFLAYCRERNLAIQDLDWKSLAKYQRQLPACSVAFVSKALHTARGFCVWTHQEGYLLWDLSSYPIPPVPAVLPLVPSVKQMQRLLKVPDVSTPVGLRNRLVLELLYGLGLRVGECRRLSIEHLDFREQTVRVWGKGDYERLLPLSPRLARLARRYLDKARPRLAKNSTEPALLISKQRRRLSIPSYTLILRTLSKKIGTKLHPHQLRHACATHLIEAGADFRLVQEFLGHRRLSSTWRYSRVAPIRLKKEFERCHPRARHPEES